MWYAKCVSAARRRGPARRRGAAVWPRRRPQRASPALPCRCSSSSGAAWVPTTCTRTTSTLSHFPLHPPRPSSPYRARVAPVSRAFTPNLIMFTVLSGYGVLRSLLLLHLFRQVFFGTPIIRVISACLIITRQNFSLALDLNNLKLFHRYWSLNYWPSILKLSLLLGSIIG